MSTQVQPVQPATHDLDEAITEAFAEGHAERPLACPLPGDKGLRLYVARVAGHARPIGVVARAGLGELARALGADVDVLDFEAVEVSRVVLPPAPPAPEPEMPARVFALVGYGTPRIVGVAARAIDLAHLVHVDERPAFMRAAGDQPWDGDRLERMWQLDRKSEEGRADWATLEIVEPIRSGLVGPALASIPQAMRAALRERTAAFAAEIEAKFQAADADGRADMAAFFESDGPRKVAEAKTKLADGTPTSEDLAAAIAPARKPVEGELTREALLADTDPQRRVRTLKFVRLHAPDSIGDTDEFRLIDPKRSSLSHAGIVEPSERERVVSAGFFEVDLEDFTVCVTDESSRSLDTGPLPDCEDNEALHAFLWPEASTSSEVRS